MLERTTATTGAAPAFDDLRTCLDDFRERFNANKLIPKLVAKWNRHIVVAADDGAGAHTMVIENQRLDSILDGTVVREDDEFAVHLVADHMTLIRIFSGDYNPSRALNDGVLTVTANDKDKVKLEAIAMLVWGIA